MENDGTSISRNWSFASELTAVDNVCLDIRKIFSRVDLRDHLFAVELLCREALNNAVIHGNKKNTSKNVLCDLRIGEDQIVLRVADEGTGFNWESALKQMGRERGSKKEPVARGRGIMIFKVFSDGISFNESGNEVYIVRKRIRNAAPPRTSAIRNRLRKKARHLPNSNESG
jgi:serine/threonine-protein kinase RsbW